MSLGLDVFVSMRGSKLAMVMRHELLGCAARPLGESLCRFPEGLVVTFVTALRSLENYSALTLTQVQSICIKKAILRVNAMFVMN